MPLCGHLAVGEADGSAATKHALMHVATPRLEAPHQPWEGAGAGLRGCRVRFGVVLSTTTISFAPQPSGRRGAKRTSQPITFGVSSQARWRLSCSRPTSGTAAATLRPQTKAHPIPLHQHSSSPTAILPVGKGGQVAAHVGSCKGVRHIEAACAAQTMSGVRCER